MSVYITLLEKTSVSSYTKTHKVKKDEIISWLDNNIGGWKTIKHVYDPDPTPELKIINAKIDMLNAKIDNITEILMYKPEGPGFFEAQQDFDHQLIKEI